MTAEQKQAVLNEMAFQLARLQYLTRAADYPSLSLDTVNTMDRIDALYLALANNTAPAPDSQYESVMSA